MHTAAARGEVWPLLFFLSSLTCVTCALLWRAPRSPPTFTLCSLLQTEDHLQAAIERATTDTAAAPLVVVAVDSSVLLACGVRDRRRRTDAQDKARPIHSFGSIQLPIAVL